MTAAEFPPGWVLGVDSGGSGLRVALARASDAKPVGTLTTREPVRTAPAGIDARHLLEQLLPAARALLARVGADGVAAVAVGAAGMASLGDDLRATLPGALAEHLGTRRLALAADAVTAYAGALGQRQGAIAAAGTGMIALGATLGTSVSGTPDIPDVSGTPKVSDVADISGKLDGSATPDASGTPDVRGNLDASGTPGTSGNVDAGASGASDSPAARRFPRTPGGSWRRADGWGHLLGDCGGGAWIGRAGLEAALRAYDGRSGGSAPLLAGLEAAFGPAAGLPGLLYPRTDRPAVLASFAPEVGRCAGDDPVSAGILRDAARSIAEAMAAVCPRSGGSELALTGGLFRMGEPLLAPLRDELSRQLPYARRVTAAGDPLDGALCIAAALATDRLILPVDSRLLHLPKPSNA
ncbi:BadF/BadG/BcrA/BcrD ATPase family protein [Streptomyces sp. NPDC004647]|uniref:N-acetylglucosamine kinase n=1 Tax=Streptomyces sp. NPDC004647 TaxID=3154671 RepID=UPI0033BBCBBA